MLPTEKLLGMHFRAPGATLWFQLHLYFFCYSCALHVFSSMLSALPSQALIHLYPSGSSHWKPSLTCQAGQGPPVAHAPICVCLPPFSAGSSWRRPGWESSVSWDQAGTEKTSGNVSVAKFSYSRTWQVVQLKTLGVQRSSDLRFPKAQPSCPGSRWPPGVTTA